MQDENLMDIREIVYPTVCVWHIWKIIEIQFTSFIHPSGPRRVLNKKNFFFTE